MATNPHIYVDSNNGTNTGTSDTSYALRQTGAMSSLPVGNVYDNLGSAITGADPSDGDFIYIADNHDDSYANGADLLINYSGAYDGAGLQVISVDTSAIDEYKPGASDVQTAGRKYLTYYNVYFAGCSLGGGSGYAIRQNVASSTLCFQDGTITGGSGGTASPISVAIDGVKIHLTNTVLQCSHADNYAMLLKNGAILNMDGGTISGTVQTTLLSNAFGSDGGARVIFNGVDLSSQSGTILTATDSTEDVLLVRLINCKLHANVTFHGELGMAHHRFEVFNSDEAGGSFYRFYVADGTGSAKNNDTVYVTATEGWYGGSDKSSIQVETTSMCSKIVPFVFELPAQYVDLSDTDTIEIELWSETTLTAGDICAFLVYPDGTTVTQPNWVSTGPSVGSGNYGHDPLSTANIVKSAAGAGSANLGASDWTGESGTPLYYTLTLDTSGDAGAVSAVSVRIEVYKASITDPIYIHPLFTLS